MNLWSNLVIVLVLLSRFEYSVSDHYNDSPKDFFVCDLNKRNEFFSCISQMYGMGSNGKDAPKTPEDGCCYATDGKFCAEIQFSKTQSHCKRNEKQDFTEVMKNAFEWWHNRHCIKNGITPSKSVCESVMKNKGPVCADYKYTCDDPNIFTDPNPPTVAKNEPKTENKTEPKTDNNSVDPISVNSLLVGLFLIISLIILF